MSQNFLKPGDWVKYRHRSPLLDEQGFQLGHLYEVGGGNMSLSVRNNDITMYLVKGGEFTSFADNFSKYRPPVTLSRGLLQ